MSLPPFKTTLPAKWVLTGEHSVLRGVPAVALPHPHLRLTLEFIPDPVRGALQVRPAHTQEMLVQLLSEILPPHQMQLLSGELILDSQIPIGAGMGSSAALCVALTEWLAPWLPLRSDQIIEFATQLEHKFHGKSSGMDVAVIASQMPISFQMNRGSRGIQKLDVSHLPRFTFHDTGIRSSTRDCIHQVSAFRKDHPEKAEWVDQRMGAASLKAIEGLKKFDRGETKEALELLQHAIQEAQQCFHDWQLVPDAARRLEQDLYGQGALAVKLTGAGGGGMMIALWSASS
jgi:mevalonate kinase